VPRQADEWTPVKRGERADSAERESTVNTQIRPWDDARPFLQEKGRETGILNEELV